MKPLLYLSIFFCCLRPTWAQTTLREGKDHALFIVVTDFDNWPSFPASTSDEVKRIEKELKEEYGFRTEFVLNPTRRQIIEKLLEYGERPFGPEEQLLLYFSMHGHFEEGRTGALIPKDGKLEDRTYDTWVAHPLLEELVTGIPCKHIVLALDACYSGTFGTQYRSKPEAHASRPGEDCSSRITKALQDKSRLYLTSGGVERTPTESQFAEKWLVALRRPDPDGILSYYELYAVLSEASPSPKFGDFRGHEPDGDFIFVNRNSCRPAMPGDKEKWIAREQDKNAWEEAKRLHTIEGYYDYQEQFPEGVFYAEAARAVSGLRDESEWSIAVQKDNPEAYQYYLDNVPNARYAAEARRRLRQFGGAVEDDQAETAFNASAIYLPGGIFSMGNQEGARDEKPVHEVRVDALFVDKTEVSFAAYDAFCQATRRPLPDDEGWGRGLRPVINVSWYDAVHYCNWKSEQDGFVPYYKILGRSVEADGSANGYRLPTEAEWEYIAQQAMAGVDSLEKIAWHSGNAALKTHEAGAHPGNSNPLKDVFGNVLEWCYDWYLEDYYSRIQYSEAVPLGPKRGTLKVARGGSWDMLPQALAPSRRMAYDPNTANSRIGFRCVRKGFNP